MSSTFQQKEKKRTLKSREARKKTEYNCTLCLSLNIVDQGSPIPGPCMGVCVAALDSHRSMNPAVNCAWIILKPSPLNCPWKNCVLWNPPLVPKRLRTAIVENKAFCSGPSLWLHFFLFFNTKNVLTVWWIWLPSVDAEQGLSISLPISPSTAFATSYPMNASLVFKM